MKLFDNVKIAYADKSDRDLNRAYFLFKVISNPIITKILTFFFKISITFGLPIKGIIKATVYKQFCGGTTIKGSQRTIEKLWQSKIGTILDFSAEGKESEDDFYRATKEIIATIIKAKNEKSIPFAVFKPTAVAPFYLLEKISNSIKLNATQTKEKKEFISRIATICESAYNNKVPLFIDAEESWIQKAIDDIALEMMRKFNKEETWIYNTLQMYRSDRISYLKEIYADAQNSNYFLGLKLVRGAYHEQEIERARKLNYNCPVHTKKEDTDKDYNLAQKFCVEHLDKISFCSGTHNEESSEYLTKLINKHKIDKNDDRIIFSQLLGMSDHVSYNLAKKGYNIAKYVPYGPVKDVMPYLIRRAEENTSIAGQMSRELSNIIKEKQRRKKS
ncbi:MAG: proline dehydrogenase family protein [Flavobacteriales bacterium]|nr:proline dehydrogenase family protein [Flavobacteriales bacterium]